MCFIRLQVCNASAVPWLLAEPYYVGCFNVLSAAVSNGLFLQTYCENITLFEILNHWMLFFFHLFRATSPPQDDSVWSGILIDMSGIMPLGDDAASTLPAVSPTSSVDFESPKGAPFRRALLPSIEDLMAGMHEQLPWVIVSICSEWERERERER